MPAVSDDPHGNTRSQVLGIGAVLADGCILRWSPLIRDNVGYGLPGLLADGEGTLAVIHRGPVRAGHPARGDEPSRCWPSTGWPQPPN